MAVNPKICYAERKFQGLGIIDKKRDFKFQMLRNKANAKLQKNIKIAKKKNTYKKHKILIR